MESESRKVAMSERSVGLQAPIVVSEIAQSCLYSGFFGRLDSARMKAVTDRILSEIERTAVEWIIIDLSNVDIIDSAVANHLIRVGDTITLLGVRVVFSGIAPVVAQTMVTAGIVFEKYRIRRNLRSALNQVYLDQGLSLSPIADTAEAKTD